MSRRRLDPDDPARQAPPPPLADLISSLSSKRGWSKRLEGAKVHERWGEIVGEDLARHLEPVRLHGGVLVVRAASPAWATQVRYLEGELIARTNAILGDGAATRVQVVVG